MRLKPFHQSSVSSFFAWLMRSKNAKSITVFRLEFTSASGESFCHAAVYAGSVTQVSPTVLKLRYSVFSTSIQCAIPLRSAYG